MGKNNQSVPASRSRTVSRQRISRGGGDSAEAALAIADQPGTTVALSYRSEAFGRVKPKQATVDAAQAAGGGCCQPREGNYERCGID
jgi:hypothetical protein